jgi:uncharacterized protein (TIGR04255 family)
MAETNTHIVEVLFAMWFKPNLNEWDSTYFGRYFERISALGYTEKQEQKQIEVKFEMGPKAGTPPAIKEGNSIRMVFKNPTKKTAIILSDNFISFHKLPPYENWQHLMSEIVEPGFEAYKKLGLGKGLKEVQSLYLNKYVLDKDQSLASVIKFWPVIDQGFESGILFQTKYEMPEGVSIQIKLNGTAIISTGKRELNFECSSFVKATEENSDYKILSQKAHDSANSAYEKLMK